MTTRLPHSSLSPRRRQTGFSAWGARVAAISLIALLLGAGLPATAEAAPAPLPLGMSMNAVSDLKAAGAAPVYGSFWVGQWMTTSGWTGLEKALVTARAEGVTPVVYWYYWGDGISPNCVEYGCDGRSRAQWTSMTKTLADTIRTQMGGREVIVVLENEFNKGGITDSGYAPKFDTHLAGVAAQLDSVAGVKLVLGFGAWGEDAWDRFPKSAAASDYIGFQMMRASTKDTEAQYRGAADRIAYLTKHVATTFNKPAFLYDLALSSYPDAKWERIQAETLGAVLDTAAASGTTGLQGVVYRTLRDNPNMDPKNYYGYAEQHWGLKKAHNGGDKAAWAVWKAKATGASSGATPSGSANSDPTTFTGVKVDEWWVQVGVSSSTSISKVEARVDGGAWTELPKQSWGAYAKSIHVRADQTVTFRATATDGTSTTSAPYARGGAPAAPAFSATFSNLKVDEWWVQASVSGTKSIAKVEVRVNGGSWTDMPKQSWGAHAKSVNVKGGQYVEFRATATDGTTDTSGQYGRGGMPHQAFSATFSSVSVQEWWVQANVNANEPLAKVEARVNGGAWTELPKQSWGAYAKSVNVKTGQSVEFRATSTDGSSAVSGKYWR